MLSNPATKYIPFKPFERDFSERTWPTKRITHPPVWMSTDLRDGNQSLIEPYQKKAEESGMLVKQYRDNIMSLMKRELQEI